MPPRPAQAPRRKWLVFAAVKCEEMYEKDPAKYHDALEKEKLPPNKLS
jgi:uridylate kinase